MANKHQVGGDESLERHVHNPHGHEADTTGLRTWHMAHMRPVGRRAMGMASAVAHAHRPSFYIQSFCIQRSSQAHICTIHTRTNRSQRSCTVYDWCPSALTHGRVLLGAS